MAGATQDCMAQDRMAQEPMAVDGAEAHAPDAGRAQPLPAVLCVDDDPAVLRVAERVLRSRFAVTTAPGPARALAIAQKAPEPFAVVVADLQMPGLSGIGLLQCIRQLSPQTARVLLSGNAELRDAVDAVNTGEIYRFITKPYDPEHLVAIVAEAVAHHRTLAAQAAAAEARGGDFAGYVTALNRVLAAVRPDALEAADRIERRVQEIGSCCAIGDVGELCAAAALSQIGAVSLPAAIANRIYGGALLSATEAVRADGVPMASAEVLANIPALATVRQFLYAAVQSGARAGEHNGGHTGEHHAGDVWASWPAEPPETGQPDERTALAGRILAAAILADECARQGMANPAPAFNAPGVDAEVRERVRTILAREDEAARVRTIPLAEVRAGMTLAADMLAPNGLLFAGSGQVVTPALVTRLRESWDGALLSQLVRVFTYAGTAAKA